MVKAIGRGLYAAGLLLLLLYFVGLHLTGFDALRDALYPFAVKTYLPLLLLAPGAFLLWLAEHGGGWRRLTRFKDFSARSGS